MQHVITNREQNIHLMYHLFFLIPLLLLGALQTYVAHKIWILLPFPYAVKMAVLAFMVLATILFFLSFFRFSDALPLGLVRWCYQIGNSWLIIFVYLLLFFFLADIARWTKILPEAWMTGNLITTICLFVSFTFLFIYAYFHYEDKQRVELNIDSQSKLSRPMKLVLVSDLHLGFHNTRSDLHRWLSLIMEEKPDAILIAGDIIDGNYRPVQEERMYEEFKALPTPTFACLGNHDYLTGLDNDLAFCHEAGIQVLRDSIAYLGDIAIVGRDDRMNPHRKNLNVIMKDVDRSKFIIELEHQPYHLEQAQQAGVSFEFAGHTHRGQVWPFNWITDVIYEDSFGPLQKGNTHYYVSSGLGIWGAKFRIGTQSEYIVLNLH